MIFSLEFCPQTYYQLSVKVELGIFPDMQAQNFTSSAPFLMKQMEDGLYQNWRKTKGGRYGIQQKERWKDKFQDKSHR